MEAPSGSEQRKAVKRIQSLYAAEYRAVDKDSIGKLCKTLVDQSEDENNPSAVRFASLNEAIRLATLWSQPELACQATDRLCQIFDVDTIDVKTKLINAFGDVSYDATTAMKVMMQAERLADQPVDQNDYDGAVKVLNAAGKLARKLKHANAISSINDRIKLIRQTKREFDKLDKHFATLNGDSRDPVANLKIGEFYCFTKGDFERGIKFLARSNNKTLRKAAMTEISGSGLLPDEVCELGDVWWEVGNSKKNLNAKAHAAELYRSVINELPGLRKKEIENRLAEVSSVLLVGFDDIWGKEWKMVFKGFNWHTVVFDPTGTVSVEINGKTNLYSWKTVPGGIYIDQVNVLVMYSAETGITSQQFKDGTVINNGYAVPKKK